MLCCDMPIPLEGMTKHSPSTSCGQSKSDLAGTCTLLSEEFVALDIFSESVANSVGTGLLLQATFQHRGPMRRSQQQCCGRCSCTLRSPYLSK